MGLFRKSFIVLVDNGHGRETPGKQSPKWNVTDQIFEWAYNRKVAAQVVLQLKAHGIDARLLVPEDCDVSLQERCRRANAIAKTNGTKNTLVVSIHLNAFTNPQSRGWEVHTYLGQSISDVYATLFWNEARDVIGSDSIMRGDHTDGDPDWDSNFAILRDTICPAVLTENLFMTNMQDCIYLNSMMGFGSIVRIHVEAIKKIAQLN